MKLLNVLSVSVFGVLFAVGCSSTDTTSTDGGADTGSSSETGGDTGTATDSGTMEETAAETGGDCNACVDSKCASEKTACAGSADCQAVIKCIIDCGTNDTCANACINDDTKPGVKEAIALITCGQDKCATECGG